MALIALLISFAAGYLLGSIPVGLLVVRWLRGVDIRQVGSGRTGGTNAMRAAGRRAFFLTGIGDSFKGLLAVLLARWIFPGQPLAEAVAGIGIITGNIWSVYIGFKGGAGGASNIGVVTGLHPLAAFVAVAAGALAFVTSRMASVATLSGCAVALLMLGLLAWWGWTPEAYIVYGVAQLVLVTIALRPNIQRILNGTERRVNFGRSGPQL